MHASPYDPLIAVSPPDWEREALDRAEAALEELAAPLRQVAQVTVEARPDPSPVRALHEAAEELGALAARRRAFPPRGGRAHRTRRRRRAAATRGPCAVAVAPTRRGADPPVLRRIGVAYIDGPEGADALALAAAVAARAGGQVRTFTVLDGSSGPAGAPQPAARLEAAENIDAKVRAAVPEDLLEATEVLDGRAADELSRVTSELDLLICGSRGYGPVRSLLLGGVSWTLAHTAKCPLLVVPRAPVPGLKCLIGDPVPPPQRS